VVTTNCAIDDLDARLQSRLGHWGMVRQIEIKALKKLRHPARSKLLKEYV
jgi:hypothetical protein